MLAFEEVMVEICFLPNCDIVEPYCTGMHYILYHDIGSGMHYIVQKYCMKVAERVQRSTSKSRAKNSINFIFHS